MFRRLLYKNLTWLFRISKWGKHRLSPAGVLIFGGMAAAGIFGVDVRQSLAFYIFSISASLLLVASLGLLKFQGAFKVQRVLPQFGVARVPLRYRLQITNTGTQNQVQLLAIDELETRLPAYEEFARSRDPQDKNRNRFDRAIGYPRFLSLVHKLSGGNIQARTVQRIFPRETQNVEMELLASRRGYIHFSRVKLCRTDPLGLVRAIKYFKKPDKLLILPSTYEVPGIVLKGLRKHQQGGLNQASLVGDSQEFMSLREYRPGDALRSIHWRSYAKMGVPVVKEFHDEYFVRQGLILDTFQENHPLEIFEEAVSVAASFCLKLPGQDAVLDLMFIADRAYRQSSGRGLGQTESLLETLACVQPAVEDNFGNLEKVVEEHCPETSGMICILLDWDQKRQDLVNLIMQQGVPAIVFVISENTVKDTLPGPLAAHPNRLNILRSGSIQEDLHKAGLDAPGHLE